MQAGSVDTALRGRIAASDPAEFLPARLAAGRQEVPDHVEPVDALELDEGRWLLLLRAGPRLIGSGVVEDGPALRRAEAGSGVAERLLAAIAGGVDDGRFVARAVGSIGNWTGERAIEVDQANDSVVVGDRAVVKRFVATSLDNARPTVLPAHLTAAGFRELPPPLGWLGWRGDADRIAPLASASAYLPGARDGWEWCVDLVVRSIDDPAVDAVGPVGALGEIAARLHAALGSPTNVLPAPRGTAGRETVAAWRAEARTNLRAAATMGGDEGDRLRAIEGAIEDELRLLDVDRTPTLPIHGDLHVGQFLRWEGGIAVADLDGDPLGGSGIEGSPARDVASLLQSLDHVGRIVERRRPDAHVGRWIDEAIEACASAYRSELDAIGAQELFDDRLLRPFRVAQELHEYRYAARYLPGWLHVPDAALPALLEGW